MCSLGVAGQADIRTPRGAPGHLCFAPRCTCLETSLSDRLYWDDDRNCANTYLRKAETLSAMTAPLGTKWASNSYFLIRAMKHGEVNGLCGEAHQDEEGGHLQCEFLSRAVCWGALPVLQLTSCCHTNYFPAKFKPAAIYWPTLNITFTSVSFHFN